MALPSSFPLLSRATHFAFQQQLNLRHDACDWPEPVAEPIALYLHIPFCESLCTYCSFHRQLFDELLAQQYFQALQQDIERAARAGWQFNQVYIGGGTPTVLPDELAQTIDLCQKRFNPNVISVETNPNHLQPSVIKKLQDVGVKRLSVGVQSLDDTLLTRMNRHPYGNSAEIIERLVASNEEFETFNVDMIFNLPGQSTASLQHDLDQLTKLDIKQISWYPLMPLAEQKQILQQSMGDYRRRNEYRMYQQIRQTLERHYQPSTAWCFNRGDQHAHDEYITESEQYLGLGSGSFSYLNHQLLATDFSIPGYISATQNNRPALVAQQSFNREQALSYRLILQLFALNLANSAPIDRGLRKLWSFEISALKKLGAVKINEQRYEVTPRGRYLALVLMKEFYISVNRLRGQLVKLAVDETRITATLLD